MTIVPLPATPSASPSPLGADAPFGASAAPPEGPGAFAAALGKAFGEANAALERADGVERAFVNGRGGMQEMVLQRAQADVALSLASATASRASQALSTILGMQI